MNKDIKKVLDLYSSTVVDDKIIPIDEDMQDSCLNIIEEYINQINCLSIDDEGNYLYDESNSFDFGDIELFTDTEEDDEFLFNTIDTKDAFVKDAKKDLCKTHSFFNDGTMDIECMCRGKKYYSKMIFIKGSGNNHNNTFYTYYLKSFIENYNLNSDKYLSIYRMSTRTLHCDNKDLKVPFKNFGTNEDSFITFSTEYNGLYDYNKETHEMSIRLDKDGNEIKFDAGEYVYCPKCKHTSIVDYCTIASLIYCEEDNLFHFFYYDLYLECPNCKERFLPENRDWQPHVKHLSTKLYYDTDGKTNKISLSNTKTKYSYYGKFINLKNFRSKITINLDTGKVYKIPDMYLDSRRKLKDSNFQCLNIFSENYAYIDSFFKDLDDTDKQYDLCMELYKALKDFYKDNDEVIAIDDYLSSKVLDQIFNNDFLDKKDADNILDMAKYFNYSFEYIMKLFKIAIDKKSYPRFDKIMLNIFKMLITYNVNPYTEFEITKKLLKYNGYHTSFIKNTNIIKSIKIYKNKNLKNEAYSIKFNTKLEKKLFNSCIENCDCVFLYTNRLIKKFKIKDINNMDKLYKLNIVFDNSTYNFMNLLFSKFAETNVINAISKIEKGYLIDMCNMYNQLVEVGLELNIRRLRLRKIHDNLVFITSRLSKQDRSYTYSDEFINTFDKNISGIKFTLAKSRYELIDIGQNLDICVGSYDIYTEKKESFIVSMIKDDKYIGCLEINNKFELKQAKSYFNRLLCKEDQQILLQYLKETNVTVNTCNVSFSYKAKSVPFKEIELVKMELVEDEELNNLVDGDVSAAHMNYNYANNNIAINNDFGDLDFVM